MPHYDLQNLEPRTFQQLIQSLAIREIGPGLTPYGDGADGARDALFQGTSTYPSPAEPWAGTLLLQIKFRQKPSGNPQKEGDWIVAQAKKDIKKLGTSKKYILPDHYILATNIDLTPVPEVGTDARARRELQELCKEKKIKNFDIWDGNKIKRLLDSHRDISITYGGYITSGDVLHAMRQKIASDQPNFEQTISEFLQHELLIDQYARLREAGSASERRTSLARVFVDLPTTSETQAEPFEHPDTTEPFIGFAQEVINAGTLRMDRQSVIARSNSEKEVFSSPTPESGRIVLIGGPGQGKSTLGQFICQLYRTAILKDRNKATLSESACDTIKSITQQCTADGLTIPKARRFPIRIDLKHFADELAHDKCNSAISYISQKIDASATSSISKSALQAWLKSYPWLVIFDGLDEVPASGNRTKVLDCINQFTTQCATLEADILIIATSRPQGYGEAFSDHLFCHRHLCPLETSQALKYAKRLTEACHPDDPNLRAEILSRLEKAASEPTTIKLMQSPLQVTILAVLAELSGELPKDRWDLFNKYYTTIFNRETQRGLTFSAVLREHRQAIDRIHRQTGLQLQIASEVAGNNDAVLPKSSFSSIARREIEESISDPITVEATVDRITEAALVRLVFLVSPRKEEIGFEIRSLQEFMAAEALMEGSDDQIISRLEAIAGIPYWRNVFLFAAGKCSSLRRYLTSNIVTICQTLNDESDPAAALTRSGSRLALELMEDDTFRTQPKQHRALAEIALRLLDLPPEHIHIRLAAACSPQKGLEQTYKTALSRFLSLKDHSQQLAAWHTASWIPTSTNPWIEPFLAQCWPTSISDQTRITSELDTEYTSPWAASKSYENALHFPPADMPNRNSLIEPPRWAAAYYALAHDRVDAKTIKTRLGTDQLNLPRISINPLNSKHPKTWAQLLPPDAANASWKLVQSNARLVLQPTKEQATIELLRISDFFTKESYSRADAWRWAIAWPLTALIDFAATKDDLRTFARQIEAGQLPPPAHWLSMEAQWEKGVDLDTAQIPPTTPEDSLNLGWTQGRIEGRIGNTIPSPIELLQLLVLLKSTSNSIARDLVATALIHGLRVASGRYHDRPPIPLDWQLNPNDFVEILSSSSTTWISIDILATLLAPKTLSPEWIEALNSIGSGNKIRIRQHEPFVGIDGFAEALVSSYTNNPTATGLLPWILAIAQSGALADQDQPISFPINRLTPKQEAQSTLIKIAFGNIKHAQAIEFAHRLKVCARAPGVAADLLRIDDIIQPHIAAPWAETILAHLHDDTSSARTTIIEMLLRVLRVRRSSFHSHESLRKLGLEHLL
ncbi:hypothetical protein JYJ95_08455 [Corallococcus exiguus]|uniref:NACHT domain-containing protein n=1 Tax=Corallococcus exiguus TaxID=83462 RepID=UPI001A8FF619|nr:hypothetical protein [Corallococcus exiguus]MBN8466541.1 hypothetical protein [Corallococcus exiguus]